MRPELNVIARDWQEFASYVFRLTVLMIAIAAIARSSEAGRAAIGIVGLIGLLRISDCCFMAERRHRTLPLLLALPIRRFNLVLAKYAGGCSMTLVVANALGLFIGDIRLWLLLNALTILLTTLCIAPAVLSSYRAGPLLPLYVLCIALFGARASVSHPGDFRPMLFDFFRMHSLRISGYAMLLSIIIMFSTAFIFRRRPR
jgi:hypothetical protein